MTLGDPYSSVKDEVIRALQKVRGLYARWQELQSVIAGRAVPQTPSLGGGIFPALDSREELDWTTNELKNALRSIDWDIEDLEDTIRIVQKNPKKFKVSDHELTIRQHYIEQTREEVTVMKKKLNINRREDDDRTARQPINDSPEKSPSKSPTKSPIKSQPIAGTHGSAKYSKLQNETDSPHRQFIPTPICNQNSMLRQQNDRFIIASNNTGTLDTLSRHVNTYEFDERQVMLDDLANEMEVITVSKLDATMKKMAKVFHLNNGNYNNYIPAPTTSTSNTSNNYNSKSSSLCSLSSTLTNCFQCAKD